MNAMARFLMLATLAATSGCASFGARTVAADHDWTAPARTVIEPDSGRPYRLHQVFVPSGSALLASTLLVPQSASPPPLVITVSGAGNGLVVPEAPVYRRLLARGYAVLALGKQGVGASSGNWRKETFEDRARNVAAAMDWAASRADVDGRRIVLHGHSQGGYVVPLLHSDQRVVALILAAGPARPVREQIVDDIRTTAVLSGQDEARAYRKAIRTRRMLDLSLSMCPMIRVHYLCNVYRFDPAEQLASIRKPVLVLFNELDQMVPPGTNIEPMRVLLQANAAAEIHVLPTADHDHAHNPSGLQSKLPGLVGPEARFARHRDEDPEHRRLARLWVNRIPYAHGYLDTVEKFVARHVPVPESP
jgi:uncharacterized protein